MICELQPSFGLFSYKSLYFFNTMVGNEWAGKKILSSELMKTELIFLLNSDTQHTFFFLEQPYFTNKNITLPIINKLIFNKYLSTTYIKYLQFLSYYFTLCFVINFCHKNFKFNFIMHFLD